MHEHVKQLLLIIFLCVTYVISFPLLAQCDGSYNPERSVTPVYPRRAAQRKIEGYAIVRFDLTAEGTVHNIQVIESEPPRVFDRAVMRAAEKLVYEPCVEDGVAIAIDNLFFKFTFRLTQ